MPANKLTDRQIAELYFGLAAHYEDCIARNLPPAEIYNELTNGIYNSVNNPFRPLCYLDNNEKAKVYQVLNAFYSATPAYKSVPPQYQTNQFFNNGHQEPKVIINNYNVNQYYTSDYANHNFNWIIIHDACHRPYYYHRPGSSSHYNSHRHHHSDSSSTSHHHGHDKKESKHGDPFANMLLIILVAAIATCAFVSLYYLLSQTANSLERLFYNEGYTQALITLLSAAVSTIAATMVMEIVAYKGVLALAIAAGVSNPLGWASFAVLGLGLTGGAALTWLNNQVIGTYRKNANEDALDPQDPSRYTLTDAEATALEKKGIDPIKVKCAIIALRAEMKEETTPSYFNRMFYANSAIQTNLKQVRLLRSGKLTEVHVGEMTFDCRTGNFGKAHDFAGQGTGVYQRPINAQRMPVSQLDPSSEPDYQRYQYAPSAPMADMAEPPPYFTDKPAYGDRMHQ